MLQSVCEQAAAAVKELLAAASYRKEELFVVGCSTSEVAGHKIGTFSSLEVAQALYRGIAQELEKVGLFLAAQCCEHLNRALVIEEQAARRYGLAPVNVVPQPKAGGSFATVCWSSFQSPVAVESLCAQGAVGMDIGGTLIGMHLRPVAVPVRLTLQKIGDAPILCARTRPKFVGGQRAIYDEALL